MDLSIFSSMFWDEVITEKVVLPFLQKVDPSGQMDAKWREHLSLLLNPTLPVVVNPPPTKAKKKTNYQVFFSTMHPIIKKEKPDTSFREISKIVSQRWHELTAEQKTAYVDQPIIPTEAPSAEPVKVVVDYQDEDDAFQILMDNDYESTSGESSTEEEEDIDECVGSDGEDNDDEYDNDLEDVFDDDAKSIIDDS